VVNSRHSCHIREGRPQLVLYAQRKHLSTHSIPFVLKGSRVYLAGELNCEQPVNIQLDLGASTSVANKEASEKLALHFDSKTTVSNTQGVAEARTSLRNTLDNGNLEWKDMPFTEVGNMHPDEDLIIGNNLFRDKVIEIDYDHKLLTIYDEVPPKVKSYRVQPVFYEQNRPKFEATITQND
jgi:hypothetical protein